MSVLVNSRARCGTRSTAPYVTGRWAAFKDVDAGCTERLLNEK